MATSRASEATVCSICGKPLNAKGECVACLLRTGLEESSTFDTKSSARLVFGDFEIVRHEDGSLCELGRGAMGVTYLARDNVLRRKVALKVIDVPAAARSSQAVRERFLREARAAAALRHPNVAAVFQFGASPNGSWCFYAMELVEGETLAIRVRRDGPLKAKLVLEIAIQITRALMAAAAQGVIHRDLKPGNIMLTRGDADTAELEVKVIDFGLAKAIADAGGEMDLTHGEFVGTPNFASPEQFESGPVDVRSDIYSLGATLWFALTGKTPFVGHSIEEIRRAQKSDALPVEQLKAARIPSSLRSLLESMLAFEPAARPGIQDLAAQLRRCSALTEIETAADVQKEIQLEIAHVLFIDIVGYSKLSINEQHSAVDELTQIVRATEQFQKGEAAERLIKIPSGDGMALVFYTSPEAPVRCAIQISRGLKDHPRLHIRMGVHSGPVRGVVDVTGRTNLAGAGLNLAQRTMKCGDAGHILLSKHVAEDLSEFEEWRPLLHDLGTCEVKHGVQVAVINLWSDDVGNRQLPQKFQALRKQRARVRWAEVAAAVLLLAGIVAAFVLVSKKSARSTSIVPEKSIAVLPFENRSEDKANAYFADGIHDEILTRLSKIADLKVISRTSTQHYKSAPENLREIARQLGVAHIVEGSVQKSGDAVRVNVQLIKAASDSHLWADSFDRKLTDIFSVETEVARAIADQLRAKLTGREEQVIAAKPTESSEAHQLYLKGRYFWNKRTSDGLKTSIDYFNQAIDKDPAYGPAYAGLADAYAVLPNYSQTRGKEAYPKAEAAAMKALEIDDKLAEAHIALANVRLWHKWARAAELEFKRGLELNRNYSTGHQWYSIYLSVLGRQNEAISEMEKAQELDPFSIIINTELGCPYLYSKRYDRAIECFSKAIQMDPDFPFAHFALAEAYDRTGRFHEALEEHEHAIDLALRGQAFDLAGGDAPRAWYALTGPLQNAYGALRGATYWQARLESAKKSYEEDTATATRLAEIYAILGDKEQALAWLAKAYEQSDDFLVFINIQPQFDKLRSDLRFQALVNKIFQGSVQQKNE
jgi:serine/threonine protein kinase/TolB-like protein